MKIEIEKPVIPQFVADWLESLYDEGGSKYDAIGIMFVYSSKYDKSVHDWYVDNKDKFIDAVIHDYEVEQEPLYYAKNKLTGQYLGDMASDEEWAYAPRWIVDKRDLHVEKLTKDEFRRIYGLDDTTVVFEEV